MKLMNLFLSLVIILCRDFHISHGENLNCEFNFYWFTYRCDVTSLDNSNNTMVITGYSGIHQPNKTDADVKAIWIHDTNTKYIPNNLGRIFHFNVLYMWNTQLIEIKTQDFSGMENLKELYLTQNKLTSVPINVFSKLGKLKQLDLRKNELEEISNGVFRHNLNLEYIDLSDNKIKLIGSTLFSGLTQLKYVDLRNNICIFKEYRGSTEINQLSIDIKINCTNPNEDSEKRHELTLNCEFKYEEFVLNIFYSCEVTTLNINNNDTIITGHSGVHSIFKYDTDVRAIHIHDTNTKFIPENLGLVFSLTSLVIEKTQLIEIKTKDFIGMRNLEELNLSQNKLTSVPIGVFSTLTRLKSLNLGENEIEEIPNGVFANNLQLNDISLYMNKIKFLGSSLFQGPLKLNRVELNYNICIDKTYEGSHGIFELKNDIRTQCKIPNEITKITTQNPAATDL